MKDYRDIAPRQLRDWLANEPESLVIIDVRQPFEYHRARLEPSTLIPLDQLQRRVAEVPTGIRVVCLCHHGTRSAHACLLLAGAGHTRLYNLRGGIEQWSIDIDPSVPRY